MSAEDFEAVALDGTVEDGTLQAELADGRVIVAEVRTVDPPEGHQCPVDWCLRQFDTESDRNRHVGFRHREQTKADCEECGESFTAPPSKQQRFCSWSCKTDAHTIAKQCPVCLDEFRTYQSEDQDYCCSECFYERGKLYDRPDKPAPLLNAIHRDGFDGETLERRAYAHLSPEWERYEVAAGVLFEQDGPPRDYEGVMAALRGREDLDPPAEQRALLDVVVSVACQLTNDSVDHVGAAEFLSVLEDATTLFEVSQAWRICRSDASRIVDRLGVRAAVTTGEAEAMQRAKEVLDAGEDFGVDEDAAWTRHPGSEADSDD